MLTPSLAPESTRGGTYFTPRVDICESTEELLVCCDLPGVRPEDVDVHFENGELSLHGKVRPRDHPGGFLHQEYGVGDFTRSFNILAEIDPERITAEFRYGELTIHLPKAEKAKPRRIAVQSF